MNPYKEFHGPATIVAGFFALMASVLSLILICQHLRSYNNPAVGSSFFTSALSLDKFGVLDIGMIIDLNFHSIDREKMTFLHCVC